jgi:hypothetical protein
MRKAVRFFLMAITLSTTMLLAVLVRGQEATPVPEPPAEIQQLDWFIGDWDVASRVKMSDDPEEWLDETAVSSVHPTISGYALLETFTGMLGGAPIEGISVRTYNSNLGKWEQRWLDNTSPGFAEYTGEYADGQFIGTSNRSFKPEDTGGRGEQSGVREIFYDIEEDRFSWRLEVTDDGGETWEPIWYLEYTRTGE